MTTHFKCTYLMYNKTRQQQMFTHQHCNWWNWMQIPISCNTGTHWSPTKRFQTHKYYKSIPRGWKSRGGKEADAPCHSWGSSPPCKRYVVASRPCWWWWRRCPSRPGSSEAGRAALGGRWWRCAERWWSCCWRWHSGRTAWPGWPRIPGLDAPYLHTARW